MISVNKTHYFQVTAEAVANKDAPELKKQFLSFAEGIIEGKGATLTIDSDIPLPEAIGFFEMTYQALLSVQKTRVPDQIKAVFEKLGLDVSVVEAKLAEYVKSGCTDPDCDCKG